MILRSSEEFSDDNFFECYHWNLHPSRHPTAKSCLSSTWLQRSLYSSQLSSKNSLSSQRCTVISAADLGSDTVWPLMMASEPGARLLIVCGSLSGGSQTLKSSWITDPLHAFTCREEKSSSWRSHSFSGHPIVTTTEGHIKRALWLSSPLIITRTNLTALFTVTE